MSIVVSDASAVGEALAISLQTPLAIDWTLAATIPGQDTSAGISNIGGGRMVAVTGATFSPPSSSLKHGEAWASDTGGTQGSWRRTSGLAMFSYLGIAYDVFSQTTGLLCYRPGDWLHAEDGSGPDLGDAGGIIRLHPNRNVGPGTPVFLQPGWSTFGRPGMNGRRDVTTRKFAVWPGHFLYDLFGPDAGVQGTLLLELTQAGATSITTAFIMNQLDPAGNVYAAGTNPDGSVVWHWVTDPPLVGGSTGTPQGLFTDGWYFHMVATHDGVIWRPYGDNQLSISARTRGRSNPLGYGPATEAFFLRDGTTMLLGTTVYGLSPCLFKSMARGAPGTFKEIVMPGNFYNFVPQGVDIGTFIFSSLYVMTHCFCELDDGTLLCAGGAPTAINPISNYNQNSPAYHYPVIWRSEDRGEVWTNISLNNEITIEGTVPLGLPGYVGPSSETDYFYEGRTLLALGGQAALLGCQIGTSNDPTWTPFFLTKDGVNFVKSAPASRVGMFAFENAWVYPTVVQTTFADDGAILAIVSLLYAGPGSVGQVEIWRGLLTGGIMTGRTLTGAMILPTTPPASTEEAQAHRAVGFLEHNPSVGIPMQELGRG